MRAFRLWLPILLTVVGLGLPASQVAAQTSCSQADRSTFNASATACSMQHSVTATVPYLASISTSSLATVSLGSATVSNMNSGYTAAVAGPSLTIAANFQYSLVAAAGGFGATGKATSDLEVATNSSAAAPTGGWTPFNGEVDLVANQSATASSATLFTFFRMRLRWASDAPGTYSSTVTYTLVAP